MLRKPPPFKGLNIRIPIKIPIEGSGFINQGTTFVGRDGEAWRGTGGSNHFCMSITAETSYRSWDVLNVSKYRGRALQPLSAFVYTPIAYSFKLRKLDTPKETSSTTTL